MLGLAVLKFVFIISSSLNGGGSSSNITDSPLKISCYPLLFHGAPRRARADCTLRARTPDPVLPTTNTTLPAVLNLLFLAGKAPGADFTGALSGRRATSGGGSADVGRRLKSRRRENKVETRHSNSYRLRFCPWGARRAAGKHAGPRAGR